MNKTVLKRWLGWFALLNWNRLRGRSFAPHPREQLFIEPTSFCNLSCRFCSYGKEVRKRSMMDHKAFRNCVDQAIAMGYRHLWLTPQTGDIFTDKTIFQRFEALEGSAIPAYSFYTNFIGADAKAIDSLGGLKKLSAIHISLYGEDADLFCAITDRSKSQFERLLTNLDALHTALAGWRGGVRIEFALRTGRSFRRDQWRGPLAQRIDALLADRRVGLSMETEYDSWGGLIGAADVEGLDIEIQNGQHYYKRGICIFAIDSTQISAEGLVNACACRDPTGALALGSLTEKPLSWILSGSNPAYIRLLDEMERGEFRSPCRACSLYRSVYDHRWAKSRPTGSVLPLAEFRRLLDDGR